jgi:hypothetical protein
MRVWGLLPLLFPLIAAAQGTASFELFGGYSYSGLAEQSAWSLGASGLSGGDARVNRSRYSSGPSAGQVSRSGESAPGESWGRLFSFGVIGGAALTDAFGYDSTTSIPLPSGGSEQVGLRSYSTRRDYAVGPMIEVSSPWRGLSVEIDALYRPMSLTTAVVLPGGTLNSVSPATVVTWEFPVLAKYRFTSSKMRPFVEAGPSFRASGNLNTAAPSVYGGTAGFGVEAHVGKVRIGPVFRYTHWAADAAVAAFGSPTKQDQVELLVGFSL